MSATSDADRDPRSEAEKARADLKRNGEMGIAPPESRDETDPSVTAETFGERGGTSPTSREDRDDPMPEAP